MGSDRMRIQRLKTGTTTPDEERAEASVGRALESGGSPLGGAALQKMESGLGHDFSQVRVHTDARADESARAVQARAYTVGNDIVFREGAYSPGSADGQKLL